MKLLKTLTLAAIIGCAGAISSFAQVLTETWTGPGGAWTLANQPGFNASGGTLQSDQQIAGGNTGSTLTIGATYSNAMQGDFLYTLFATNVSMNLSANVLDGVRYVQLEAGYGGGATLTEGSINFNFDNILSSSFSSRSFGQTDMGEMFVATWLWEIDAVDVNTPFEFSWVLAGPHSTVPVIALTQSVEAIPEPSTYGLIGIGLLFSGYMASRRRSRSAAV